MDMKRDNGAALAIGVLAAFAAAAEISRRRRGSSNDDGEDVEVQALELYRTSDRRDPSTQMQSRHAAQARAQLAMPDGQLARRAYLGGDVLDGMSFEEAVNADPRRIDGLITQEISPLFGSAPPSISGFYERAARDLRAASGGRMTASALVGVMTRNDVLAMRFAHFSKDDVREMLPDIEQRVGRAAGIARRASMHATNPEDRRSWMELHDYFVAFPARLRSALSGRLSSHGYLALE
jgi:hypothetical protein